MSLYSEVSPCASSAQQGFAIPFSKGQVTARGTRWPLECHQSPTGPEPQTCGEGGWQELLCPRSTGGAPQNPPGHSCWESQGSGTLCSPPFLPTSNLEVRERWGSTSCLWCFWKTLEILEARSFYLGIFELLLSGNPGRELGWARPEPRGSGRG